MQRHLIGMQLERVGALRGIELGDLFSPWLALTVTTQMGNSNSILIMISTTHLHKTMD